MTQQGSMRTNWTSDNGVSAADLNRIEQGVKDSLPKDGSEEFTGKFKAAKNTSGTLDGNFYTTSNIEIVTNDGSRPAIAFHRGGVFATAIFMDTDGNFKTIDNLGNIFTLWTGRKMGALSGLDADMLRGITIGGGAYQIAQRDGNGKLHAQVFDSQDTRSVNSPPNFYSMGVYHEFKQGSVVGLPSEAWVHLRTIRPWTDDSAGWTFQEAYGTQTGKKYVRRGNLTIWQSWGTEWDSTNDGSNSGLDADLLRGYVLSTEIGGLTVAHRDGSGQLKAKAFYAEGTGANGGGRFYVGDDALIEDFDTANAIRILGQQNPAAGEIYVTNKNYLVWHRGDLRVNNGVLEFIDGGTWKTAGGIKKVQRGLYNHGSGDERFIDIGQINPDKAYVIISYSGEYSNTAINSDIRARIASPTQIGLYKRSLNPVELAWQVVEFY